MAEIQTPEQIIRTFSKPSTALRECIEELNDLENWQADLPKKVIEVLQYMQLIESLVDSYYLRFIEKTPSNNNQYITQFLVNWNKEETYHSKVLNKVLQKCNATPIEACGSLEMPSKVISYVPEKVFWAFHMVIGALNETTARFGYMQLAEQVEDETLQTILRTIAKEESRHQSFYAKMATYYLSEIPWITRKAILAYVRLRWGGSGAGEVGIQHAQKVKEVVIFPYKDKLTAAIERNLEKMRLYPTLLGIPLNMKKTPLFR